MSVTLCYCAGALVGMIKLFTLPGRPIILVFKSAFQNSDSNTLKTGSNTGSYEKFAILDQYLSISHEMIEDRITVSIDH